MKRAKCVRNGQGTKRPGYEMTCTPLFGEIVNGHTLTVGTNNMFLFFNDNSSTHI